MRRKIFSKITLLFLILTLFLTCFYSTTHAVSEFIVDTEIEYVFDDQGNAKITHTITLENVFASLFAKSYSLELNSLNAKNITLSEKNHELVVTQDADNKTTDIKIIFHDNVVGKGAKRTFSINYDLTELSTRTGEVWEITIPKIIDNETFRNYQITIFVPNSYGKLSNITPEPISSSQSGQYRIFKYDKTIVGNSGIHGAFGEFQVFTFLIKYHLENPVAVDTLIEIPIPPDTHFQKIYYENIDPIPNDITLDVNGNWLASYPIDKREIKDVTIKGYVQILSKENKNLPDISDDMSVFLDEKQYWESNDPLIQDLARKLKTPESIYNYVVDTLDYSYQRVNPNVKRLGARSSLDQPKNAICMEFTDLFIALARAAGIPAREINGYAHTENPAIQPLSLVSDVLHSWPEYWDQDKGAWVQVDPTWQDTTGGLDFFNHLDLKHFAFVIHGTDSTLPHPPGSYKLGSNPEKDVYINFGKLPAEKSPNIEIKINKVSHWFSLSEKYLVSIVNLGPSAIYSQSALVYFDNKLVDKKSPQYLLPFSKFQFEIDVPFSLFANKTPREIQVNFINFQSKIQPNKYLIILVTAVVSSLSLLLLILGVLLYQHRVKVNKIKNEIYSQIKKKLK